MSEDQAVKVFNGLNTQPDICHCLQLVKRDRSAGASALEAQLGPLIGTRYPVEQRGNIVRIWIGFFDRCRQQRSCQGPFLQMHALGESRQPSGMLGVERNVQPLGGALHDKSVLHASARIV